MTFIGGQIQHIPGSQGAVNALGLPGIKNSREMRHSKRSAWFINTRCDIDQVYLEIELISLG